MLPGGDLFGLETALPRLRTDLVISAQRYRGKMSYVIKDPIALRYYRLGEPEYHVGQLLDGKRTLAEVAGLLQQKYPGQDFAPQTILRILFYFVQMSFLQLRADQATRVFAYLHEAREKQKARQALFSWASIFVYFKVTLFDPDILLLKMEKRLRFLWHPLTLVAMGCLAGLAVGLVLHHADRLQSRLPEFLTLHNLFWLWTTLVGVKVVHEFGHGLMCKHYGGEVHGMGAMCIVLTPFLFCDATDSWMFKNKWHKIATNMAGILVELVLASLATLVWVFTEPGLVNQLALNVMVVCSVSTIVFNANPLMKFDGYYVLADFLEMPNLRDRAGRQVMGFITGLFTGQSTEDADESSWWRRMTFIVYAVASYLYTWYVTFRIFGTIGLKLEPYGLAAIGKGLLFFTYAAGILIPIWMLGKQLAPKFKGGMGGFISSRVAKVSGGLVLGVLLLLICPWPVRVTTSCVLDGSNRVSVRAKLDGFIRGVEVREGSVVRPGQLLASLENDEVWKQLRVQESQAALIELKRQAAGAQNNLSGVTQLNKEAIELETVLRTLQQKADGLQLKAPVDGVVLTGDLESHRGTFLQEGGVFCEILPAGQISVVIALTEEQAGLVRADQKLEFRLHSMPGRLFRGKVTKTFSAASYVLPHAAMAGRFGGEVPTQLDAGGQERPANTMYQAELAIENPDGLLRPGMSGRAKIQCGRSTIGHIIGNKLRAFFRLDYQL